MSLGRQLETEKYIGSVQLGEGYINARMKNNESIIYKGSIKELISANTDEDVKQIIYVARAVCAGSKYVF